MQSWLSALYSAKGKPLSASQKNKVLITMRALCDLALSDEKIKKNPLAGIKVSDLDAGRNRILIQRSIDIDGSEKGTKTGKSREVPVPPELMAKLIDKAKTLKNSDCLFLSHLGKPWTRDSWGTLWQKIAPAAGVDNLLTHELRHTAVSWAIAAGANIKMVQRMVGHATAAMTLDVYGHLWEDELDVVMVRVGEFIKSRRKAAAEPLPANVELTSKKETPPQQGLIP